MHKRFHLFNNLTFFIIPSNFIMVDYVNVFILWILITLFYISYNDIFPHYVRPFQRSVRHTPDCFDLAIKKVLVLEWTARLWMVGGLSAHRTHSFHTGDYLR